MADNGEALGKVCCFMKPWIRETENYCVVWYSPHTGCKRDTQLSLFTDGYGRRCVWTELAYHSSRPRRFKFLCSVKHHTEDAWRLYSLHYEFLISALDGGGRLVSRPRRFTPQGESTPPPPQHPLGGGFGGSPKQCGHNGEYHPLAWWFTDLIIAVSSK
jgi:hypothetical protein